MHFQNLNRKIILKQIPMNYLYLKDLKEQIEENSTSEYNADGAKPIIIMPLQL